jgi:hypothetical protein
VQRYNVFLTIVQFFREKFVKTAKKAYLCNH